MTRTLVPGLSRTAAVHVVDTVTSICNRALEWRAYHNLRASGLTELDDIRQRACRGTDIADHLETLFVETLLARPRLVVELGVRGGESTFALERAANLVEARLVGVDLTDCRESSEWQRWIFVQADDIEFGCQFRDWALREELPNEIDILFIDTSHEFGHTRRELATWLPLLSRSGKAILHDTNLKPLSRRREGGFIRGWDNARGVIRAVEDLLDANLSEGRAFTEVHGDWLVRHVPYSHGLTILDALGSRNGTIRTT